MSYIHFKSIVDTKYNQVTFDGVHLTLVQLKKLIFEKTKYNRQLDYDLEITNEETNESYKNDTDLIYKNSRVLVRRAIKNPSGPLRSQANKQPTPSQPPAQIQVVEQPKKIATPTPQIQPTPIQQSKPSVDLVKNEPIDTKSVDKSLESLMPLNVPISNPLVVQPADPSTKTEESIAEARKEEKSKLESLFASNQQTLQQYDQKRYQNRFTKPNIQRQANYVCSLCKKTGHSKHQCPEVQSGAISREELHRPKYPHGIPRCSMVKVDQNVPGAMLGPEGYVIPTIDLEATKKNKPEKQIFLTEEEEQEQARKKKLEELKNELVAFPKELTCPFSGEHGKHLIKDAVLLPCCGHFVCCDECIRVKIINNESVECPNKECGVEIDSIESVTPYHPVRNLVQEYLNEQKAAKLTKKEETSSTTIASLTGTTTTIKTEDALVNSLLNDIVKESPKIPANIKIELPCELKSEQDESDEIKPKSPLQDSNISSSITNGQATQPPIDGIKQQQQQQEEDKSKVALPAVIISSSEQRIQRIGHPTTMTIPQPPYMQPQYTRAPMMPTYPTQAFRPQRPLINYPPMSQSIVMDQYANGSGAYMPITSTSMHTHNVLPQTVMHPYGHPPYGQAMLQHMIRPHMQASVPTAGPAYMSEADFYRYKEKLKEKERYESNVHEFISKGRRASRSRSKSRTRRSRSRSPYSRHTKRRTRSRSRRRSRSRSSSYRRRRSRSYSKRSHDSHKHKKRSRSRTRRSRTRSRDRQYRSRSKDRRRRSRTKSKDRQRDNKKSDSTNQQQQQQPKEKDSKDQKEQEPKKIEEKQTVKDEKEKIAEKRRSVTRHEIDDKTSETDEPARKHKKSSKDEKQDKNELDMDNDSDKKSKHKKSKKKHKHKHRRSVSR